MASVLILSIHGDGVPLALRMAEEGHIVKMYIRETNYRAALEGYRNPSLIGSPTKMIEQYDLVISDMVGQGQLCEEMKEKGKLIIGGGTFNDRIELDRSYGEKAWSYLTEADKPNSLAKTPSTTKVTSKGQLLDTLKKATTPQVIKPQGNKSSMLTTISNDPDNRALVSMVNSNGEEMLPCIVQDRIDGVEISTEGWFNGKEWIKPFNHTVEKKRLMEGDKGPNTGCMGNVVWLTQSDKLTQAVLEPMAPLLTKVGYIGPLDVNTIVTREAAYFLELTARFGYDAIQALFELLKQPVFDVLYNIAGGTDKPWQMSEEYAIAVRLSSPPYPSTEGAEKWKGVQLVDVPSEAKKHVWLSDTMKVDGVNVLAGVDGVIGCVTARGESIREAKRRIYRTIKNITIHEDVQYRNDIDAGVEDSIKMLRESEWLN